MYNDETLLRFAVVHADSSAASRQIVQALLDAGADPNVTPGQNVGNLVLTIPDPELTGMLLKAGANPNRIDSGDRPAWWDVLSVDSDAGFETLQLLLGHGADVSLRDREGGPVEWAAYHAWMSHVSSWRLIQFLIEHGATWKDEQAFWRTVVDTFNESLKERERSAEGLPQPMTLLKATFDGPLPRPYSHPIGFHYHQPCLRIPADLEGEHEYQAGASPPCCFCGLCRPGFGSGPAHGRAHRGVS